MCGCETCISANGMHASLLAWRKRVLRKFQQECANSEGRRSYETAKSRFRRYQSECFPQDQPLHAKAKDAAMSTMCPCLPGHVDLPKWKCVLTCCSDCPSLFVPAEEQVVNNHLPNISFHCYKNVTRCSLHGQRPFNEGRKCAECEEQDSTSNVDVKVYCCKEMVLMNTSITDFHCDYYCPAIHKLAFHLPHVAILGTNHCGKLRRETFKRRQAFKDAKCCQDYAERLVAQFANQIQSKYYGSNRSVSMEGVALEHFKATLVDAVANPSNDDIIQAVFHSFLSDDSAQDGATTATHTRQLLQKLLDSDIIKAGLSTLWESTDGCAEQYRSATALFLLSALAHALNIAIDRAIGAPGHGKDVVDGLNAVDKNYLKTLMSQIQVPGADNLHNAFAAHVCTDQGMQSLAAECKRLLSLPERVNGVVGDAKSRKREQKQKWVQQEYHIQDKLDVQHTGVNMGLKQDMFPELPFANVRPKPHGVRGLTKHYHVRLDPKLGQGKCAIRRIPCCCKPCTDQLDKAWQPGVPDKQQQ